MADQVDLSSTVAVVVHHRSYETIHGSVAALLAQGIDPRFLIVVDNSEEPARRDELREGIPEGVQVKFTSNLGYGAAVNAAVQFFLRGAVRPQFFVVATHETKPIGQAVRDLVSTLGEEPAAAVAGPTLISGDLMDVPFIWSQGGYLSKVGHLPRHIGHRTPLPSDASPETADAPVARAWLDGAFLVYRWEDISANPIDERFFLYMEETELHLRLGDAGRKVLWVPSAVVWQSSGGTPPYYFARNLRLLFSLREPVWRRSVVPLFAALRVGGAAAIRQRDGSVARQLLRGLTSPLPQLKEGPPDRARRN